MADTPDTNEVRLHGQFTQVDENGDVTVLYPNTTVDDITGILPIEKGGTGSSSEQDFVQNIINNILNNSDLTDISQLYSKFITSVDERPNTLNTFTNSGWYYFNYLHAPVGNVHPAIYNGDISEEHMVSTDGDQYTFTDPGFLFVINYGTHICQYWIPALKRGINSNEEKNSIYERKCEDTYWSEWVHLNGDSNASSVYNVTFTNSYIEDATTIFKYKTNTGAFKFKHGNIVIINVEWQGFNNLKIQIDNDNARELDYGNPIIGTDNLSNQLDMTTTLILLCNVISYKIIVKLDTRYTLDGSYNDDDEWVTTLTPSVGEATSSTVPVMQGATSTESGSSGLVPAPEIEDRDKFLKGDGSWTTIPVMQGATSTESGSSGLVPAPNNPADRQKFLKGDGSWSNVHQYIESVGTGLYRFSTDNEGHVASTLEVTKSDITRLGIPSENTTYSVFSTTANGLVPKPDSASATKFLNASGTWTTIPSGTNNGADYAEFVKPWFAGNSDNEDRIGYMVTIKNGYLYKANEGDYIIGITSGNPSIVGNAGEDYYWKYERDEFNRIVYELVDETKEETDENGNKIIVKTSNKINAPKISSNYDPSLANSYVERKYRPEWSYVGMRGIVPVRDDGTCEAGGFCKCGTDGIATKSERGLDTYYVIERINDHVVSVEVK